MHDRPWSTVIRVPTIGGDVFFKAVVSTAASRGGAHRAPRVAPARLHPAAARGRPRPRLDADGGRRTDAPRADRGRARTEPLDRRASALCRRPDRPGERRADELLAIGVPDLRLASLARAGRGGARRDRRPARRRDGAGSGRRCRGFARRAPSSPRAGLPETIQHDDLHDAQVFVRDGRYLLLDWGDACVSHPFFTLAVTLDGVISWGVDDVEASEPTEPYRDAYLEPFRGRTTSDLVGPRADSATAGLGLPRAQQPSLAAVGREHEAAAADVPRRPRHENRVG